MLVELRLENYVVVDNLAVEFAAGLNLLTGETGAGKSILIDALCLLLGDKASPDVIRTGSDKASLLAVFELEAAAERAATHVLEENGIEPDGPSIILRREVASSGKGRTFVNNQPATVHVLRLLAPHLAAIHAQSESIVSFDAGSRLALLDSYAGTSLEPTAEAFSLWKQLRTRIADLERDEQDRLRLLDLWTFQKREIEECQPQAGEDDRLESEKRVLANAEKIHNAAVSAFDVLYEGNNSASTLLRSAQRSVEELSRYDHKFQEALSALDAARISIEDVGATLRDYAGGIQASPEHLAEVEDRLAVLDRLKRKYGPTLDDVVHFAAEVSRKLSELENKDEVLQRLRKELAAAGEAYLQLARVLSRKRYDAARKLEKLVEAEINDLAMRSRFQIEVNGGDDEPSWTASGFDTVEYMIATNPGEPLRPLEQIASGGELSRTMLALKASVESGPAKKRTTAGQRTLVFDEIDIGIGGRAAEAVGRKLKNLARSHQVLCVTHLPQIAAFADHHFLIEKKSSASRTRTTVREIVGEERTEEVARMLSGAKLTETSLKHAEQMLKINR